MPNTPRKIYGLRDYNDPGHISLEDGMVSQQKSESAKALRGGRGNGDKNSLRV